MSCNCNHERYENDDALFMAICEAYAPKSHCISKQVASIAVLDGKTICSGVNGTLPGVTNCCESYENKVFTREEHHEWSLKNEIHSEIALLQYAAKKGISLEGSTLYCTLEPCINCSVALSNVGIKRIVYGKKYEFTPPEASEILKKANIELHHHKG